MICRTLGKVSLTAITHMTNPFIPMDRNRRSLPWNPATNIGILCFTTRWLYDDVIKWEHFPRYWPFVWGINRSTGKAPQKASDVEFWCFLWSAIAVIMTLLYWIETDVVYQEIQRRVSACYVLQHDDIISLSFQIEKNQAVKIEIKNKIYPLGIWSWWNMTFDRTKPSQN